MKNPIEFLVMWYFKSKPPPKILWQIAPMMIYECLCLVSFLWTLNCNLVFYITERKMVIKYQLKKKKKMAIFSQGIAMKKMAIISSYLYSWSLAENVIFQTSKKKWLSKSMNSCQCYARKYRSNQNFVLFLKSSEIF